MLKQQSLATRIDDVCDSHADAIVENLFEVTEEFAIEGRDFLIVCYRGFSEALATSTLSFSFKASWYSEVARFETDSYLCAVMTAEVNEVSTTRRRETEDTSVDLLTERELQIVQLVARGYPNKAIARRLGISRWTVSTHLKRIFLKLQVDSRAAMVYKCTLVLGKLNK